MSHEEEGGRWKAYEKLGKGNGLERQGKGVGGGVVTPLDEGERRYSCRVELCSMASTSKYREGKTTQKNVEQRAKQGLKRLRVQQMRPAIKGPDPQAPVECLFYQQKNTGSSSENEMIWKKSGVSDLAAIRSGRPQSWRMLQPPTRAWSSPSGAIPVTARAPPPERLQLLPLPAVSHSPPCCELPHLSRGPISNASGARVLCGPGCLSGVKEWCIKWLIARLF